MALSIGIRAHDLVEKATPEDLAAALHQHGFQNVQLVFNKTFFPYSYADDFVERVLQALQAKAIRVVMLGAYFNPVHSDLSLVQKGVANFKSNLTLAARFGHCLVGSETGSFSDSPWVYHPQNRTEEGYQKSKRVFQELSHFADEVGADIALEGAFGHVMYCPRVLKRLVDELDSPHIFVTLDLFNYLSESNFADRDAIFEEALTLFGAKIKVVHLKDGRLENSKLIQVAPGQGDFHYPWMLKRLRESCPDATLIFEGVKVPEIDPAFAYLRSL